jgi:hypothetical protein
MSAQIQQSSPDREAVAQREDKERHAHRIKLLARADFEKRCAKKCTSVLAPDRGRSVDAYVDPMAKYRAGQDGGSGHAAERAATGPQPRIGILPASDPTYPTPSPAPHPL